MESFNSCKNFYFVIVIEEDQHFHFRAVQSMLRVGGMVGCSPWFYPAGLCAKPNCPSGQLPSLINGV
jgi:hypothetical protein